MTAEEILQGLDARFDVVHHDPPHLYQLWTHFYPADTRLTAFRSDDRWAIVFEILGYWRVPQEVRLDIFVYGTGVGEQTAHYQSAPLRLLDAHSDEPLDGHGLLDPARFSILWNERYDFTPSERDYAEAGIVLDTARPDPCAHAHAQMVRYLCERLDHPFFLPEEDLRDLVAQSRGEEGVPSADAMTLLLQTRSWRHPDLSQEELPSQMGSFQTLARALETGDISAWDRQDPASFNTDWRVYDWEEKAAEEQRREWESRQDTVWEMLPADTRARVTAEAGSKAGSLILLPPDPHDGGTG